MTYPGKLNERHVSAFLNSLATNKASRSTQLQALNALVFLYKTILHKDIGTIPEVDWIRSKTKIRLIPSEDEIRAVLNQLGGVRRLIISLIYGTGIRAAEAISLQIASLDFAQNIILVNQGKGGKQRLVGMPQLLKPALINHTSAPPNKFFHV